MKYLFSTMLILSAMLWAQGPVSYYGKMQVNGAFIRSPVTNKAMQVKGVSFFWSQWGDGSRFYNENAVDRMAQDWKAEIVRAAYGSTGYNLSDSAGIVNKERIETVVEAAIKNDIYVIIDWHSHSAHEAEETERAKEFFAYFSEKYGAYDNVIFELYNEPLNTTWAGIKTYAEQVIPEIRKHSSNLILVGTPYYAQQIETVIGNAIDDVNLGYVFHFYAASHSLGSFSGNIAAVQQAKLPVFVTEFGTTNADGGNPNACNNATPPVCVNNYDTHSKTRTDDWLAFFDSRNISYVAWSISDKYEGSAFFGETNRSFDQTVPENWTDTRFMTASGEYVMNMLQSSYAKAPWNTTPILLNSEKAAATGLRASNNMVYIDIANPGNAILNAYSLNGTLLANVFSGHLSAGSHQFSLNSLPKGVFILRLSQKNDKTSTIFIKKIL